MCVCVCVRERERESEQERVRAREREGRGEGGERMRTRETENKGFFSHLQKNQATGSMSLSPYLLPGYRCCYCYTFNPARKQKPQAPRIEKSLRLHDDAAEADATPRRVAPAPPGDADAPRETQSAEDSRLSEGEAPSSFNVSFSLTQRVLYEYRTEFQFCV